MNAEKPRPSPLREEKDRNVELLRKETIGLQARFLLGDLTNPQLTITHKKLRPIQERGAQGINDQAVQMYQGASVTQRRRHQDETGLTYKKWQDGFDKYLQSIRQDTRRSDRNTFLETLGITPDITADDFYNEYLQDTSDIIKFVDDVVQQASPDQIVRHQDILRNLGNAFGYESSEVIENLIHGVKNVTTDVDKFIKQAAQRVNRPEIVAHPLLQKTQKDSRKEEVSPPVNRGKREEQAKEPPQKTSPSRKKFPPAVKPPPERPLHVALPVKRVDLEKESASVKPPERREEGRQVYPAPAHKQTELARLTQDELDTAIRYLLYNDVYRENTESQAALLRVSEMTKYYARELYQIMQEYGKDFVIGRAQEAVRALERYLHVLGLKRDKHSKSKSWYLWGIAKSRFLAENPQIQQALPNAEKYESFDPLFHYRAGSHSEDGKKSLKAEVDILQGMLGWEVFRQRKKIGDILFHLDPMIAHREKRRLQELLEEQPKGGEIPTLSSYKLREIGRLVLTNIRTG